MSGETDLQTLLKSLTVALAEDLFVFVTLPAGQMPNDIPAQMVFHEAEGTTLILRKEIADARSLRHEFPCRMLTLNIHSSLEAVDFMAVIATELAKLGIGVNPVSAFYHDHLFVPDGQEARAIAALEHLAAQAG